MLQERKLTNKCLFIFTVDLQSHKDTADVNFRSQLPLLRLQLPLSLSALLPPAVGEMNYLLTQGRFHSNSERFNVNIKSHPGPLNVA